MNATRTWIPADQIRARDAAFRVRQVYCWITTSDDKIITASKDGSHWQFPGGKPADDETLLETLIREVYEQTGLDIDEYASDIKLFGYYKIAEWDEAYLQLRYTLQIPQSSNNLSLFEREGEADENKVEHILPCSIEELQEKMAWLNESDELNTFINWHEKNNNTITV